MTKTTLRKPNVTSYKNTRRRNDPLRNPSDAGLPPIDVNTIDYDIQHDVVDVGQWDDGVKIISSIISSPASVSQRLYNTNRTEISNQRRDRVKEGGTAIKTNALKSKLTEKYGILDNSHLIRSDKLSFKIPYKVPERISYPLLSLINSPTSANHSAVSNKSKTSNTVIDDLISKYTTIKKRSINKNGLRHVLKDSSLLSNLGPLKRSDGGNHNSFSFFSRGSNEEDIDPVSSIFDKEFLFGGTQTGFTGTTPFPIVDKDYDYNAEYDYVKDNSPSEEELRSEETYEDDKEGNSNESNEESVSSNIKPKKNSKVVINVVKQEDTQESNENEEDDDEDVDIVREPPIIVLYKGGDSKQLQPGFEYALTHGGLDPRYLTKDPLAGPLATQGFNHNFQAMRGAPIQGNVVQNSRRYPTVGGFNTTQIHAILQPGPLPPTTMSGNNNKTTIGVVPIAPTDYVGYGRPVNMGQYFTHPYPGNSQYMARPISSYIVRPNYYGGRGRRPPSMIGQIRSPSALVMATSPRYIPSYRGGHMLRYRGNRNHMARYRPIHVGIPKSTRMAIQLTRRESNNEVANPLL